MVGYKETKNGRTLVFVNRINNIRLTPALPELLLDLRRPTADQRGGPTGILADAALPLRRNAQAKNNRAQKHKNRLTHATA